MDILTTRKLWLLLAAVVFVFLLLFKPGSPGASPGSYYSLAAPSFVGVALAAPDNLAIETIQSEAGISAYFQSTTPVSISSVRSVYQTIEIETSTYILGSVALANYPENHAPHVYVHADGWFMAYYLNTDPVSKIVDWNAYTASGDTVISTKLQNVLTIVAGAAGVGIPGITHYDFRYPNATTMMIIAERYAGINNNFFTINIPTSFGVAERSWTIFTGGGHPTGGSLTLNGTHLHNSSANGHYFGIVSAAQMPPATTHTVVINNSIEDVGGIVLVYTE
jgi:hypothetical protein